VKIKDFFDSHFRVFTMCKDVPPYLALTHD
jgi:hypothetical protein